MSKDKKRPKFNGKVPYLSVFYVVDKRNTIIGRRKIKEKESIN